MAAKAYCLTLALVFIYLNIGCIKLYPLDKDMHLFMRKQYVKYAKVFPTTYFGYPPIEAKYYRCYSGIIEIAAALVLGLASNTACKKLAIKILTISAGLWAYSEAAIGTNCSYKRVLFPMVLVVLLAVRSRYETWSFIRRNQPEVEAELVPEQG